MNRNPHFQPSERSLRTVLTCLLLVFAAVFSATFAGGRATSLETHAETIASIDQKKETVMALTASATLASAMISAIPDDTATPISDKLADLSQYFLIILCVLYAEKYLLPVLGFSVFRLMIPAACLCFLLTLLFRQGWSRKMGIKLLVCGLLMYAAVPVSILTSDSIYRTYEASIEDTISAAEQITDEAETIKEENNDSLWNVITGAAGSFKDSASKILNRFVEALAVMIVTTCLIPLLVLLFFIWLVRTFTGIDLPEPKKLKRRREPPELPDLK